MSDPPAPTVEWFGDAGLVPATERETALVVRAKIDAFLAVAETLEGMSANPVIQGISVHDAFLCAAKGLREGVVKSVMPAGGTAH